MFRLVNTILVLNLIGTVLANGSPEVSIDSGKIRGGTGRTQHDRPYYYFTGIPYAKPPVGWYRFEPPSPVKPWNDTFDATRTPSICVQYDINYETISGDEDCLYLNVYTPKELPRGDDPLLPVMFYIGGDQFQFDDVRKEKIGPELLLDKDVLLVTASYRLGVLGFFVTEDNTVQSNLGLKDQLSALQWVHRNIEQFGGDPNRITVFGNGAGGASAHYHMISPLSKDLINGVISQSGTALNLWAYIPIQVIGIRSRTVAGLVGCPTQESNKVMVKCLKTVQPRDILNATLYATGYAPVAIFSPVKEQFRENGFLSEDPIDIIKQGKAANVPFLSGITTENGGHQAQMLLNSPAKLEDFDTNFEERGSWLLYFGVTAIVKNRIPIAQKVRKYYFDDYSINSGTKKELTNLFTDAWFLEGLRMSTDIHMKHSTKPVFNYLFGYRGSETYLKSLSSTKNGASHRDELLYLFRNSNDFPDYEPKESDKKMTELLVTLWTNFATYGHPTPPEDTSLPFTWKPAVQGESNYLSIKKNGDVALEQDLLSKRSDFWVSLLVDSRRERVKDEL